VSPTRLVAVGLVGSAWLTGAPAFVDDDARADAPAVVLPAAPRVVANAPAAGRARWVVHTELQASFPAAGTVHRIPIPEIRLRFSTAVQLGLSTVTVLGPGGVLRDADSLAYVAGSEERELSLPLRSTLTTGAYTVEWRSAGPDGHPIRGTFAFEVEWEPQADTLQTTGDTSAAAPATADSLALSEVTGGHAAPGAASPAALARWLLYLVMAGSLGGALFRGSVLARVARTPELAPAAEAAGARLTLMGWAAALAGVAALPALLGLQAVAVFGGTGLAPGNLARLVASPWGRAWLLQAGGVALLVGGLAWARRGRGVPGWGLVAAAGLAIAIGSALSGHARAEAGWLPVAVQAVHGAAAAAWVGGLAALVLVVLPGSGKAPAALPRFVAAFSPVALTAVSILLLTGVVNAWDRLGGLGALVASGYGRTLLLKLALVGGAATLGFHNWRTVRPALAKDPRPGLLRVPVTFELVLAAGVLLVTAFLVVLPTPSDPS
jgi:copper transport protein